MRNLGFLSLATAMAMWAAPANASPFDNPGSDTTGWTLVTGVGCQDAHWVQGPVGPGLTACPGPGSPPTTTQNGNGDTTGTTQTGGENFPPPDGSAPDSAGGSASDSTGGSGSDSLFGVVDETSDSGLQLSNGGSSDGGSIDNTSGSPPPPDPGPGQPGGQLSLPEPATLALFGAGLAGLGALRRRRKAKS